jgi:MORN repeat
MNTENFVSKFFVTSSQYEGNWNDRDDKMDGFGQYRFPNGSKYFGQFSDGKFQGAGILQLPNGSKFFGQWQNNQMTDFTYTFGDGLEFKAKNWEYLRRVLNQPYRKCKDMVGKSDYLDQELRRDIPPDGFDTIDGIYMPDRKYVVDYKDHRKVIR